jgi:hypothetical protein
MLRRYPNSRSRASFRQPVGETTRPSGRCLVPRTNQGYGQWVEAWSRWRGSADNDRRWMFWALVSALLHVPFTPLVGVFGLVGWFMNRDPDVPLGPPITAIPIDILEEPAESPPPEPAAQPLAPAPPAPAPPPAAVGPKPPPKRESPAASASAAPSAAPPKPSAEAPNSGAPIADPVAMSGGAKKVVDPNANVRLLVDAEKVRSHRLGPRIGSLLSRVHQWRDFMGPAGLDPVRDIDRILIAGPQLRRSGEVVAVIQHHLGRERMRQAIDGLVARDTANGAWLDAPVPVARASADRAERYFVLPSERIVVVTPESALEAAKALGSGLKLRALPGSQVAIAYLATPHRAFMGLPLRIPQSISSARAVASPTETGLRIDIDADDASPEQARENATVLEREIKTVARPSLGVFGAVLGIQLKSFVDKVAFRAEGKRILGEISLTHDQIESLLGFASMALVPEDDRAGTVPTATAAPADRPSRAPSGSLQTP